MSSSENMLGSISKPFSTGEFHWLINVCSDEILDTNSFLKSPKFSFANCSWHITMYPKGYNPHCNEWISLYLWKEKSQSEKNMRICVALTVQEKMHAHYTATKIFKKSKDLIAWYKYMRREDVLYWLSRETKGLLCIQIKFNQNVPSKEDVKKQDTMLSQNYKDFLLHDNKHDLILKVKEKEFKVHQNIMQFRCPVFKPMLAHDMLERNTGVVEIPDCDPLAFEQFIFYVYTGNVETLDKSIMLSLYYIADKYDMRNLQQMCCEFIKMSLSARNVFEVIRLAIFHSDSSLLESANIYFVNNATHVLPTTEWLSFMNDNPVVANELMIKTVSYYKPKGNKTETETMNKNA